MDMPTKASLQKVTLHAARSKAFPEGSARHRYDFVAPLDETGHINLDAWKRHRTECVVHRFWGDEPPLRGQLVHRAGGQGGSTWAFDYGPQHGDNDETGYRFADHAFRLGEYVTIREADGELVTFSVAKVNKR